MLQRRMLGHPGSSPRMLSEVKPSMTTPGGSSNRISGRQHAVYSQSVRAAAAAASAPICRKAGRCAWRGGAHPGLSSSCGSCCEGAPSAAMPSRVKRLSMAVTAPARGAGSLAAGCCTCRRAEPSANQLVHCQFSPRVPMPHQVSKQMAQNLSALLWWAHTQRCTWCTVGL